MEYSDNDIAKLCEIGVIFGQLSEKGEIKNTFNDLYSAYDSFKSIYNDWQNDVKIKDDEERAYITAYANRILKEKFAA